MSVSISSQRLISISVTAFLKCTAITGVVAYALNPLAILANPIEFNLPIYRQAQESYNQFMQRAENSAKTTINSRFKQDPTLDEIKMVVIGENEGAIAPLLSVKVSRQAWINEPQVQRWATYFADSQFLLGFDRQVPSEQPPTAENPPSPTPEEEQPSEPQQVPLIGDPPEERQRNPLPVPTQRLRNAGNQLPFVDPVDVRQLRPNLIP